MELGPRHGLKLCYPLIDDGTMSPFCANIQSMSIRFKVSTRLRSPGIRSPRISPLAKSEFWTSSSTSDRWMWLKRWGNHGPLEWFQLGQSRPWIPDKDTNRIILDEHVLSWKKGGHGEDDGLTTNIKITKLNYRERFICHTIACMLDSMKRNIFSKSEFWSNPNRVPLSPFWVQAVRDPGLTIHLSYEVLSTNGRPRSLEEQCLLQLKVNLDDVQIKNLRNKIPETLHKKLLHIVPN